MAIYEKGVLKPITPVIEWLQGHAPSVVELPVAASQTIKVGDILVKSVSAGTLSQAIAAGSTADRCTNSGGSLTELYYAVSDKTTGAAVTAADKVSVVPLGKGARIRLRLCVTATGSSAKAGGSGSTATALLAANSVAQLGRVLDENSVAFYVMTLTTSNGELKYLKTDADSANADHFTVIWATLGTSIL